MGNGVGTLAGASMTRPPLRRCMPRTRSGSSIRSASQSRATWPVCSRRRNRPSASSACRSFQRRGPGCRAVECADEAEGWRHRESGGSVVAALQGRRACVRRARLHPRLIPVPRRRITQRALPFAGYEGTPWCYRRVSRYGRPVLALPHRSHQDRPPRARTLGFRSARNERYLLPRHRSRRPPAPGRDRHRSRDRSSGRPARRPRVPSAPQNQRSDPAENPARPIQAARTWRPRMDPRGPAISTSSADSCPTRRASPRFTASSHSSTTASDPKLIPPPYDSSPRSTGHVPGTWRCRANRGMTRCLWQVADTSVRGSPVTSGLLTGHDREGR